MAEGDGANGANTMNCYGCATVAVGHSSRRPVATGGAWSRASGPPSQVRRQVCDIPHGSGSQIAAQQQWRNERTSGETADGDRPVVHNAVTGSMFGWLSHRARCVVGAIPFFFLSVRHPRRTRFPESRPERHRERISERIPESVSERGPETAGERNNGFFLKETFLKAAFQNKRLLGKNLDIVFQKPFREPFPAFFQKEPHFHADYNI